MDTAKVNVKLIDIDLIEKAIYNPRKKVSEQLFLLEKSLKQFGWIIPAYVDENNTLLSGHQRLDIWKKLGETKVPCIKVPDLSQKHKKGFNLLFNLATNDFSRNFVKEKIELPANIEQESSEKFPCLRVEYVNYKEIIELNPLQSKDLDGWQYSRMFIKRNIIIPIILDKNGIIANGVKRFYSFLRSKVVNIPVIRVDFEKSTFEVYLNKISMDFTIKENLARELRFNSFRRLRLKRSKLGLGFSFWAEFKDPGNSFNQTSRKNVYKLRKAFGKSTIDFGAGHLLESKMLEEIGIKAYPFDPYIPKDKDTPDLRLSRKVGLVFLEAVANKTNFESVICSSVFNSIPFYEDRDHVLRILASLSKKLYLTTMNVNAQQMKRVTGDTYLSKREAKTPYLVANYENGTVIGDISTGTFKSQKCYSKAELKSQVKKFYNDVRVYKADYNYHVLALDPKPIDKSDLKRSLSFEFNLPYPNGSLNLHQEAIESWQKRGIL